MRNKPYFKFSTDQLAADKDFKRWALHPTDADLLFWQEFLAQYPDQLEKIQTARKLVQIAAHLNPEEGLSAARKQFLHDRILSAVKSEDKRITRRRFTWSAAAAIALLVVSGAFYLLNGRLNREIIYQTAFGERLQIELPDGSHVDLNANSQLKLAKNWNQGDRHVWLKGEAFFTVEKKPATGARFTVHTDGLAIEVLGTQFNVNTRLENTQVLLEEGKVRLMTDEKQAEKEVFLAPGELASFSPKTGKISKQQLQQTEPYISWKDGYLIYEKATIAEVIQDIQTNYGLEVKISGTLLLEKKIRGAVPTDNLNEFLEMVETLFDIKATKTGNVIMLKPKTDPESTKSEN